MNDQVSPSHYTPIAGPFGLTAFVSGTRRSIWECATCQGPISIGCRALEHVDRCQALLANDKPCERMYSTRYGCSKHPYYEGHNPHMRKYLCRVPIKSYSTSNLMPKSRTPSPKRPSSPVETRTPPSGLRHVQMPGPNVPPAPPTTPQPGQPKLEAAFASEKAKESVMKTEVKADDKSASSCFSGQASFHSVPTISVVKP
ncbi:unnamed protein product [Zymoseptoria tritici ST99CH_1A5]|uniref:Uncharacterized protein n=3 Tax=Zymoseptoria tritici TaxID=1047171 RepID=A0A1X7RDF0_ZYMT9|nr:unnamed protein product [Zymoseptoria tritici ST99CH_3D7]SMR41810.1 unnamed protein product [Zymoseptoria tritici ST99CH_1E4]SMR44000.1 unnamed protein product [Zymoseptoria tritici ST99CH_3D1]SMY19157.1 unnamed protein product [Zymoseptoria tritici ST99CH_1A5]